MTNEPIIEFNQVDFNYNDISVLEDINLVVNKGDYLGLIGPNGSGKTTLLRLVLGLLETKTGQVKLFGQSPKQLKDWTKIGYIPQKATQFENPFPITVEEVVSLGRIAKKGLFGKFDHSDWSAVAEAMSQVGITRLKKKLVSQLSGGQQQRVFIAKALVSDPEVLILDEPTIGIDSQSQELFYQLLGKLNKQGKTIIIVSHDIDVVANEVSVIACLNKTMVCHGTPKEFINGDYIEKLYGKGKKLIHHGH